MLRRLFAVLMAMVIVVILVGFLLPRAISFERQRVMDHPGEVIFEVLGDFRHFPKWSPWYEQTPEADYRIEGAAQGIGATLVWSDEQGSGAGRLWIVDMQPNEQIEMRMELGDSEAETYFRIEPEGLAHRVSWGMRIEFGAFDLVGRYIGLMLPGMVGRQYTQGLERLEAYLDESPGRVPSLPDDPEGILDETRSNRF